jgi:BirA family biotin operon repressor/biotin-[acetyl-CoA-carboxylase] ligase
LSPENSEVFVQSRSREREKSAGLSALVAPFRLHTFPRLRSTNDHAAVMRRQGRLFAPAIVLTRHQTAGRGRGKNVWYSGPGCLTVTFVLPIHDQIAPHHVPLIAGLAVRNAAAEISGNDAIQLKWPNDLLFGGRKLAGLLCERVQKVDLIGLGLNIDPDRRAIPAPLRPHVATLREAAGKPIDADAALIAVARQLRLMMDRAAERPIAELLREYDTHHALIGKKVQVTDAAGDAIHVGTCQGLDHMGRLLLKHRRGTDRIISGQVQMG